MEKNIYFFTELKPKKVSTDIPLSFFKKGICEEENGITKFKVTGIFVSEKDVFVIFPKGIFEHNDRSQNIVIAQTLFQVLLKYNKESIQEFQVSFGENNNNSSFFSLVNWLVDDFKKYGLIRKEFKKKEINGNGRINWSKTIKETTPYIINGNILYLDTINIKSMRDLNSEITVVHYNILKEIEQEYGWLLNFNLNVPLNFNAVRFSYNRMRYTLNNALRFTFNQKEITLYKMLISYIDSKITAKGKRNFYLLYTKYYQYIWETICKQLFDDKLDLQCLLPKPYWKVESIEHETEQIPDILTTDESNNLYIIDAKYYRPYEGIKYLPGWKDMVKQFFYASSIDRSQYNEVYNVFIFPSPNGDENQPLLDHGIASIKGRESEFGEINSYNLNSLFAMNLYLNNEQGDIKQHLIDYLNDKA
jgi:hypothetical protein